MNYSGFNLNLFQLLLNDTFSWLILCASQFTLSPAQINLIRDSNPTVYTKARYPNYDVHMHAFSLY